MSGKHFENGKSYTLGGLFAKGIKLIIPDLQRDYCWGSLEKEKKLVSGFVDSLLDLFKSGNEGSNLGLIYGYESVENHIELCDGQQRITTLYLLLGLLNRHDEDNSFETYLKTSEDELRLQYAIRESTLYFLEDLARHFFVKENDISVRDLKNETWYFKDYDLDPSIQSMLDALNAIEQKLRGVKAVQFGEFIVNHISFLYIDLGNRKNGEETFVVINTTGEPLSATENLKPLLITKQPQEHQNACSKKWEEWETFFWQNRGENDTADNGLKEFFRWITLLNLDRQNDDGLAEFERIQDEETDDYDFSTILNAVTFDDICRYFDIVKSIFSDKPIFGNGDDKALLSPNAKGNQKIDWFKVLPVIAYCKKFPDHTERDLLRVKQFFSNVAKIDNVSKSVKELLPKAIDIIYNLPDSDITSILKEKDVSTQILSEEEKEKFNLYLNKKYVRTELEDKFWKEEVHPVWNGEIQPLIEWSKPNGVFDVTKFDSYAETFNRLFHGDMKYEGLDITRRALLTLNLNKYPKIFKGYTNYSFCYESSDWQTLIKENEKEFGEFIKELLNGKDDIYAEQEKMINNSSKEYKDKLKYFVKHPELLKYCEQKNVQWDDDLETWWLIPKKHATKYIKLENFLLYLDLKPKYDDIKNWEISYWEYDGSVAYLQNADETAIDIFYEGSNKYTLQLFNRDYKLSEKKYKSMAGELGLQWNGERYEHPNMTKQKLFSLVKKIVDSFE